MTTKTRIFLCQDEYFTTIKYSSLQFGRNREKCFSPYLGWIQHWVCDGKFNNSKFCNDRYKYLVCFIIPYSQIHKFRIHHLEWKTDVTKQIKIEKVVLIKK